MGAPADQDRHADRVPVRRAPRPGLPPADGPMVRLLPVRPAHPAFTTAQSVPVMARAPAAARCARCAGHAAADPQPCAAPTARSEPAAANAGRGLAALIRLRRARAACGLRARAGAELLVPQPLKRGCRIGEEKACEATRGLFPFYGLAASG